jgi:hypothetical protein
MYMILMEKNFFFYLFMIHFMLLCAYMLVAFAINEIITI